MKAENILIEHLKNPLGIDIQNPFVSWTIASGETQSAYRVVARNGLITGTDSEIIFDTGIVKSDAQHARINYIAGSRERVIVSVTLWDENGIEGDTIEAFYEMGLLFYEDFKADWITCENTDPGIEEKNSAEKRPALYFEKSFTVNKTGVSRLYITCHGLYTAFINGKRVENAVLTPGPANYDAYSEYQTYDVSDLLVKGQNKIEITLGNGWYKSASGVDGERNIYGDTLALICQIETDGQVVCATDKNWMCSCNGPIRDNDMQQGETVDLNCDTVTDFHPVRVCDLKKNNLISANAVPVTEHECFSGRVFKTPNGETVSDFGQNLAGYIKVHANAKKGEYIKITTGETLDQSGNFTQENFEERKRHKEGGIRQELIIYFKDGENVYKPSFTIWGFRYARIETNADISRIDLKAIAVYSDMEEKITFNSSNEDLNRLFKNAMWSMKSNFCYVPTDCPTRERAAWTGDIGIFVRTGLRLMDCYTVLRKWLRDLRTSQYPDGRIPNIAPRNNNPGIFSKILSGSVGWGDACIIVPYEMYLYSGDERILIDNYDMMVKWYDYLLKRAKKRPFGLKKRFKKIPNRDFFIETGIDYGEWCEPGISSISEMKTVKSDVATAYLAESGKMLQKIATVLNKNKDAEKFKCASEKAKEAFEFVFVRDGHINSERQADYVRAVSFDLLSENEKENAARDLNNLIVKNNFKLNTGFLSTGKLLAALSDNGYTDTAYDVLLNKEMPGWIYQVRKGATTIWEMWDGIDEKGIPKGSLNHYSKGAVVLWIIETMCGIKEDFGCVKTEPHPTDKLDFAYAKCKTEKGIVTSGFGKKMIIEI